ncbi:RNA polymerase sigma factor [Candidatus Uhrbacteria bacterium]|nr:RNA polymerase sigma factor [Candidatus Uhrbacteria bacterium]
MSNLLDRYLLFRIRTKRDPEAFARIYDRYVNALYRFVLLKLPSKEDAQDITAETFTKTWNYLQDHQRVTHVRALLYQIARNLISDYYRTRPEARGVEFLSVTSDPDSPSHSVGHDAQDHGRDQELMEARAELALVLEQIGKLKDDYRDVVTLRLVDGLAFGDISKILGKSSSNVRVMFHRALKMLKD